MKSLFSFSLVAVSVSVLLTPQVASAALVSCSGLDCSACDLVSMGNSFIVWLIGIIFVLFAVLAVVAGFQLVTSGGNPSALSAAKDKFTNAFIGLMIVLAAWLLVDTLMRGLVGNGGNITVAGYGPWSQVKCQSLNASTIIPSSTLISTIPPGSVPVGSLIASGYTIDPCGASSQSACAAWCSTNYPGSAAWTGAQLNSPAYSPTSNYCVSQSNGPLPVSTDACTPLNPVTDPIAQQMESGSKVIWTNTDPALQRCAQKLGGTVTSAYRSAAYQAHLKEIHTKACSTSFSACTDPAVKNAILAEMSKHGLSCSRPVAINSNHTSGLAVDISGGPQADGQCMNWFGSGDPVHYTLTPGCTCP